MWTMTWTSIYFNAFCWNDCHLLNYPTGKLCIESGIIFSADCIDFSLPTLVELKRPAALSGCPSKWEAEFMKAGESTILYWGRQISIFFFFLLSSIDKQVHRICILLFHLVSLPFFALYYTCYETLESRTAKSHKAFISPLRLEEEMKHFYFHLK